jgi:beta-glucoside operon transcriptional antiterminator
MWVIKKINNNVAMGKDSRNREVVLFGKGIGYGGNTSLLSLLDEIDEEIWNLTFRIVDRGKVVLNTNLKSSFTFVLADYLNFAVERIKKGLVISNPLQYDIEHLYEKEMELAEWAISLIDKKIRIKLPHAEAANIALHFAEAAEVASQMENKNDIEWVIEDVTKIVEESLGLKLDRKEFNYSRFVTHVQYLIQREN